MKKKSILSLATMSLKKDRGPDRHRSRDDERPRDYRKREPDRREPEQRPPGKSEAKIELVRGAHLENTPEGEEVHNGRERTAV